MRISLSVPGPMMERIRSAGDVLGLERSDTVRALITLGLLQTYAQERRAEEYGILQGIMASQRDMFLDLRVALKAVSEEADAQKSEREAKLEAQIQELQQVTEEPKPKKRGSRS